MVEEGAGAIIHENGKVLDDYLGYHPHASRRASGERPFKAEASGAMGPARRPNPGIRAACVAIGKRPQWAFVKVARQRCRCRPMPL